MELSPQSSPRESISHDDSCTLWESSIEELSPRPPVVREVSRALPPFPILHYSEPIVDIEDADEVIAYCTGPSGVPKPRCGVVPNTWLPRIVRDTVGPPPLELPGHRFYSFGR